MERRVLGLALGSGAAFGLAHIGVLRVIERENIGIDVISGSSIGALIAAIWGLGFSSDDIERIAKRLRLRLNIMRLMDFTFPISGILAGRRLRRFLKAILGEKRFEDLKIPVKIMVYDLANRETLAIDKGRLLDAVYKSIAVPGIFSPIIEDDRMLVDGGVLDPVPVDILFKNGATNVIAVNVLPSPKDIYERNMALREIAKEEENIIRQGLLTEQLDVHMTRFFRKIFTPNIFDVIMTSMQAMEYNIAENSCRKADISLHPVLSDATSIDFQLVKRFIKRGEDEVLKYIQDIKALV
jgi:NTE family protein